MLCERCHEKEATIHIEKIINGKREKHNFCADCAKQENAAGSLGALGFNLAELLFHAEKPAENPPAPPPDITCPVCGWDWEKLQSSGGKLGCPECYSAFAPVIDGVLNQVQRGKIHIGRRPQKRGTSRPALEFELEKLQKSLADLVKREEYEQAAVCRDRIAALKRQLAELGESK